MRPCPQFLDKAQVICSTPIDERNRHTGNTRQIVNGELLGPVAGLAICQYEGESAYYLFGCDEQWKVQSDTCHATLEEALDQAEFEYEGTRQTWHYYSY
jgi:hypothetical protein